MSFGGQSNAWQRNMMEGHPQSSSFHPGPAQQQMFMPQQNNMAAFGGGGMYPSGGGSVSYPQPRTGGLNPIAFQGSGVGGDVMTPTHYNSIGTVTKINNDCGLVNNEIFFYRNVCKGPEPKLGDRVIFEATYSSSGQFKWNATRIQLMQPIPQSIMNSSKGSYNSPTNDYRGQMQHRHPSPKRVSPMRGPTGIRHERDRRDRERHHRSRDRDDDEHERKRRREDLDRSHERNISGVRASNSLVLSSRSERDREREPRRAREPTERAREREAREQREREREKPRDVENSRSVLPKGGRRTCAIRRYRVNIPKSLLCNKRADVQELRNRYKTFYIPSEFFHANIKWTETFTPDNPLSLRRPARFHIMHKLVEPPTGQKQDELEPPDADYVYSVKVMLMALPPIAKIYKKCFETNDNVTDHSGTHLSRLINFLVGIRVRNEPMAIGGPWSPSLDGENPDTDPSVLIRTAIRTCKAMTGIDLSNCTQWYRFVELYYHRTEYKNKVKDGPPRVETVVIYLPDVNSCMPTIKEYETLSELYKKSAENIIARRAAAYSKAVAAATTTDDNTESTTNEAVAEEDAEGGADENVAEETEQNTGGEETADAVGEDDDACANADEGGKADDDGDENNAADAEENENDGDEQEEMDTLDEAAEADDDADNAHEAADENEDPSPEPTHYTLLDLKTMKVQEIRDELLARDLPEKGVRNVVMARLAKALNIEKAAEMKAKNRERLQKIQQQKMAAKSEAAKKADQKGAKKDEPKGNANAKKKAAAKKNDKNDNKDDWADDIDFESGDIVILDEYDASKHPEDKEMTEREKKQLIRRYTLPSSPQIVVHPNRMARAGIMSLAELLDYDSNDTKECIFEVSLFAKLFNEMLMRDFAFTIYKEIYLYNGTDHDSSEENAEGAEDVKSEKDPTDEANGAKDDAEVKSEEPPSKIRKRRMSTVDGREYDKVLENGEMKAPQSKPQRRMSTVDGRERDPQLSTDDKKVVAAKPQRRLSTIDGRELDAATSSTKPAKKMVVVKPQLLLAFTYFDTTHCGYIFEKDLEDLFAVLGLNLSRSQIKKVLGKLSNRQSIHYRKLTDREDSLETTPTIEDIDDLPPEELREIASGNNKYEFVFGETHSNHPCVIPIDGDENKDADLINYNGAVIHVGKLMQQIKRTEKNYSDLEKLYNDVMKQNLELEREHTRSSSKIKDFQSTLKSLTRKLSEFKQDYYSLDRKYRDQNSTLSYIYTRVAPYFIREENKDKDKDIKSESSHKDKDDRKKEEDKSKDKEKNSEKEREKGKDKESEKEKVKASEEEKPKDKDDRVHDKKKESDKEASKVAEKSKETGKETDKEKSKSKETEKETCEEKETPMEMEEETKVEEMKSEETKEEKKVEEKKVEEKKVEEKKVEEKKVEKKKVEEKKAEEKKVEEKKVTPREPVKETKDEKEKLKPKEPETAKETTTKTPTQTVVTKATPVKATPTKATPAKAAPPKTAPAKATPVKATPAKATPAKATPAKAAPPAKATPAKVNPTVKKPVAAVVKKPTT